MICTDTDTDTDAGNDVFHSLGQVCVTCVAHTLCTFQNITLTTLCFETCETNCRLETIGTHATVLTVETGKGTPGIGASAKISIGRCRYPSILAGIGRYPYRSNSILADVYRECDLLPPVNVVCWCFESYHVCMCVVVAVFPVHSLTFESIDVETSVLMCTVHIHLQNIWVTFIYQSRQVKVKITGAKDYTSVTKYRHLQLVHLWLEGSLVIKSVQYAHSNISDMIPRLYMFDLFLTVREICCVSGKTKGNNQWWIFGSKSEEEIRWEMFS